MNTKLDSDSEIPTKMRPEQEYLRESIRQWMSLLCRELGHYEQTTHGSLTAHDCSLKIVLNSLAECYEKPNAFNISELDQCIHRWVKTH